MPFNSLPFAIFLTVVLTGVLFLGKRNADKKIFLIAASLFFYMYWKIEYVWLLVGAILFNYSFARLIGNNEKTETRKQLVLLAVAGNILFLAVFKYADFIIESLNGILAFFNLKVFHSVNRVLPIGISFFTFQAICYVVDVYKNKIKPASLSDTSLYLSFFPHLIAGPIIRATQIFPQFERANVLRRDNLISGGHRIFWGLVKKMVLADSLAIFVNQVFGGYQQYSWLTLLISVYAFAFQIYFDFSAYSDIAIGCFKMLDYDIPENFNLPYAASNFSDFWRRWHMSLSGWLKDYLYIPLGGSRNGLRRTYVNLMITMLLGGLWHGAKWTFVIWGILHGAYLVVQKFSEKRIILPDNFFINSINIFITFQFVCLAWIFFRAENLTSALSMLYAIVTFKSGYFFITNNVLIILFMAILLHIVESFLPVHKIFISMPYYIRCFAYSLGVFLLFFNRASISSQFIYFQF